MYRHILSPHTDNSNCIHGIHTRCWTHLSLQESSAVQYSQLGSHICLRISPNPQSCQVKHMHCRQTHRQVNMDYSVGRETDTTAEVCLSVCVSVYFVCRVFRDRRCRPLGHFSQILSQMASCLLNSSRLLLCWGEGVIDEAALVKTPAM